MEEKALISVLTPCYNTGSYLHRLLDSVLTQTYPRVEMFCIDDGSTDNTREVIESYIPRFEHRGYYLTYLYQENSGQSVAINMGLKLVTGKYLVWPDSDDYYNSPDALARMAEALEEAPAEYAMVRTQEYMVEDETLRVICIRGEHAHEHEPKSLFEDCMLEKNEFYYCSGAYMVDIQKFRSVNSQDIYTEKDAGQNWQLMLPVLYSYRCITIMEPLYCVVLRTSSHSRGQYQGYVQICKKIQSYANTILGTIERIKPMPVDERNRYSERIREKYGKQLMLNAFRARSHYDYLRFYAFGKPKGGYSLPYKLLKCRIMFNLANGCFVMLRAVKHNIFAIHQKKG